MEKVPVAITHTILNISCLPYFFMFFFGFSPFCSLIFGNSRGLCPHHACPAYETVSKHGPEYTSIVVYTTFPSFFAFTLPILYNRVDGRKREAQP
jgi:hypothetical protein